MEKKLRKINYRELIGYGICFVVLVSLFIVGTFYDLQISEFLTKGSLMSGEYETKDFMAIAVEVVGPFPIYLNISMASLIVGKFFFDMKNSKKKYLSIIFLVICLISQIIFIKESIKYILRFSNNYNLMNNIFIVLTYIILGLLFTLLGGFFYFKIDGDINKKLMKFAYICYCMVLAYVVIKIIKGPISRIRYRTMNLVGDFSYYVPWYKIGNGKNTLINTLEVGSFAYEDGFESFPSGHTVSAGTCLVLICLPNLFETINKSKIRYLFYIIPFLYTLLVAYYRIVAGAHFLTDVTFSFIVDLIFILMFRYIFITRKCNQEKNKS